MAASDSSLAAVYEAMEKTLNELALGYETAVAHKDASYISKTLTPDCIRHFMPESFLKAMGAPVDFTADNKSYEDRFALHIPVHATHKTEVKKHRGAAAVVYHCKYIDGEPMSIEFAWFLDFTDDGTQVKEISEIIDSLETPKFEARSASLLKEHEAQK